jgi:hypothetical protein
VNDEGLLEDMGAVETVLERFSDVMPKRDLAVLWVTTAVHRESDRRAPAGWQLLGYDVACYSPFWSVIADPPRDMTLPELNQCGLVASRQAGEEIRDAFGDTPDGGELEMLVWELWQRPAAT